jgi:hypothetical protein
MRSNNLMMGNDSRETILSSRFHPSQDVNQPSKPQHHRDERSTCSTVSSLFSESVSPSRSYARHQEQPFDESDMTEEILHRIEAAQAPFEERKEEKILPIQEQQEEETFFDDLREIPSDEVPPNSRCASCDKITRTHLDDDIKHLMKEDVIVGEVGCMENSIIPNPVDTQRTKLHPTDEKVSLPTVAFPNRKNAKNIQVDQDKTAHLIIDELGCMEDPVIPNPFAKPRTKSHPTYGKVALPTVAFPNRKKAKDVQVDQDETDHIIVDDELGCMEDPIIPNPFAKQRPTVAFLNRKKAKNEVDQDETDHKGTTTRRRPLHISDNTRENHIIDGNEDSCSVSTLVHVNDNRLPQETASSTPNILGNSSGVDMAPARRIRRQARKTSGIFHRRDFSLIEPELEEADQKVCRSNIARETRRSRLSINMMGRCQKAKRSQGSASLQRFAKILVPFLFRILSQHRQKRLENSHHGQMVTSRQSLSREHVLSGMVKLAMLMIQQNNARKHNGGDSCLIDSEDEVKEIMDKELRRLFRDMNETLNETLEIFSFPSDESLPETSLGRFEDYLDDDGLSGELERSLDETNRPEILDSLGDGDPQFQELFETACMATDLSRHDYIDAHYYDNLLLEDDDDMDEELANLYWVEKKIKSELSQVLSVEEQVETETNLPVTELSVDEKHPCNESRDIRLLAYELCPYKKMDKILRSGRDGNESQQGSTAAQTLKDCDMPTTMLLFPDLESVPSDEQGRVPTADTIFASAESEILGQFRDEVESRKDQEADGSITKLSAEEKKYFRDESRDTKLSADKMCLQDKMNTVVRSRDNNESQQGCTAGQTLKDCYMPTKVLPFPDLESVPTDEQDQNPTEDNIFAAAESELLGQFRDEVESRPGQEAHGTSLSHSEETILETVFSAPSEEMNPSFDTIDMWRAKISGIVDCEKSTPDQEADGSVTKLSAEDKKYFRDEPRDTKLPAGKRCLQDKMNTVVRSRDNNESQQGCTDGQTLKDWDMPTKVLPFPDLESVPTDEQDQNSTEDNDFDAAESELLGQFRDEVESRPGQEAHGTSLSHSEGTILETVFSVPSEEMNPSFDTIDMWRAKISEIVDCEESTPSTEGEPPGTPDPNDHMFMETIFGAPSIDDLESRRNVVDSIKSTGSKSEDPEIPDPNDEMIMETVFVAPSLEMITEALFTLSEDSDDMDNVEQGRSETKDAGDTVEQEDLLPTLQRNKVFPKNGHTDVAHKAAENALTPEESIAQDVMEKDEGCFSPTMDDLVPLIAASRDGRNVANPSRREEPDCLLGIRPMVHFKDDEKKQSEESPSDDDNFFSAVDGEHAASILGLSVESALTNPCAEETSGTLLGIQPMVFHEKPAKEKDYFVSIDGESVTSMLSPSAGSASVHRSWEEYSVSTGNLEYTRELVGQALLQMKPLPTINYTPHHAKIHPTQVKQVTEKQKGGEFDQDFPSLLSASSESKADVPNEYRGANYPGLLNASIFSVPKATSARIVAGRESKGMVLSEHNRHVLKDPLQSPASRKLDLKALKKSLRDISKQEKQETNEDVTVTVINKDENSPPISELEIMELPGVVSDLEMPPRQNLGMCNCVLVGQSTDSSIGNSIQDVQILNKIGLKPMAQRRRPLPTDRKSTQDVQILNKIGLKPLGLDLWEAEAHLSTPEWAMDPMIDEHNADSIVKALGLVLKTGGNLDESPPTNGCLKDCVTPLAAESFTAFSQAIFPKVAAKQKCIMMSEAAKQKCIMMSEKDDNETLTSDEKETNDPTIDEHTVGSIAKALSSSMELLHLRPSGDDKIEALRDQYDGEYPPEEEGSFCNDWGGEELLNHQVGDYIEANDWGGEELLNHQVGDYIEANDWGGEELLNHQVGDFIEAMRSESSETLLNPIGDHPIYSSSSDCLNHQVGDFIEAMRSESSETLLNPIGEHPVYSSNSSNWKDHPPRMMMKKKEEPNHVFQETVVGKSRTFDEDRADLALHFASPQGSLLGPYDGFLEQQQQQQAMMERPDDISELTLVVDTAAATRGMNRPTTTSSSRTPLEQFRREGGGPINCSNDRVEAFREAWTEKGGELVVAAMESGNSFWCNSEGDPLNVLGSMIRGCFAQEPSNPNAAAGR